MSSAENTEKPVEETKTEVCGYHPLADILSPSCPLAAHSSLALSSNVTEHRIATAAAREQCRPGADGEDKVLGSFGEPEATDIPTI